MAARACAVWASRCSFVANRWSNPASATTSMLAAEMSPRSATTQIRPTANRWARSANTSAKVVKSLVFPPNTRCAIGIPSEVHNRPMTIWDRSERWSREYPNARDGNRSGRRVEPSKYA